MIRQRPVPVRPRARIRRRTSAALALLTGALALGALPAAAAPRVADEGPDGTPLTLRLEQLVPATMPTKGSVILAGTVTNDSDDTYTAINIHPFISPTPLTDRDALAEAARTDPEAEVGGRLAEFESIGDLEPGRSAAFKIGVPVKDLPINLSAAGVYWIGVHARAQSEVGRGTVGRARTFIPLVPDGAKATEVSLVVPLRERVRRAPDGSLLNTDDWSVTLQGQGRLRRIVDLLAESPNTPVNMLVDPAVVEAIEDVADGNPALSFGTAVEEEPSPSPGSEESDGTTRSLRRLDAVDQANAESWLRAFGTATAARRVLGLGYADPDTAALARRSPTLLDRSTALSAETFKRLGLDATPAVAPPDGWLDDTALPRVDQDALVLVSDHSAPRNRTQWRTTNEQDLAFTDAQASSGGPGPTPRLDALAVRQRVLADAALRSASGASGPMVVTLPPSWDPGDDWRSADLLTGFDQPWLDLVGLLTPAAGTPTFDAALGYPAEEQAEEIGGPNIAVARQLAATGKVLEQLLRTENDVKHDVGAIALDAVSYQARDDQPRAAAQVRATDAALKRRLGAVEVIGTDFVTLSGGSGTVAVTLVNRLDQPIEVGVSTRSSSNVRIETPDPLTMAPGQRTVLRLRANASEIGVHSVTLTPVTTSGLALGTPLTFTLRTSQVGALIWAVLIAAAVLLVVMIARRVLRGVREHRWRP